MFGNRVAIVEVERDANGAERDEQHVSPGDEAEERKRLFGRQPLLRHGVLRGAHVEEVVGSDRQAQQQAEAVDTAAGSEEGVDEAREDGWQQGEDEHREEGLPRAPVVALGSRDDCVARRVFQQWIIKGKVNKALKRRK